MRVLVVEDNPIDVAVLDERLKAPGSPVRDVEYVDRLEALEQRNGPTPDVVLVDLSLPDARGLEVLRRARAQLGDVAFVVITSDEDPSRSIESLREGAEDYLQKGSFTADLLHRALRYARERAEWRRRLAHADRLTVVGRMASGVAHEVANPAALALAHIERLEQSLEAARPLDRQAIADAASQTRAALNRIRAVVRDLQDYACVERTRTEQVDLDACVGRVVSLVAPSVRHTAQLSTILGGVGAISADAGQVEQIITNLVVNATHAVVADPSRGGHVRITTERLDGLAVLEVEDDGVGMDGAVLARIFEPYFTTRHDRGGTGLGLTIVAEMVRVQGGTIRCESAPSKGTKFIVTWPSAEREASAPTQTAVVEVPPTDVRRRLLFVDDEPGICELYAELLGMTHDVTVAVGGVAAIEALESDAAFDVVVCDLMMPTADGIDVYEAAARLRPELARRFVICSGGLVTQRAREFDERRVAKILYKPVPLRELFLAIDRATGDAR